jgi:hypothetical protein
MNDFALTYDPAYILGNVLWCIAPVVLAIAGFVGLFYAEYYRRRWWRECQRRRNLAEMNRWERQTSDELKRIITRHTTVTQTGHHEEPNPHYRPR